MRPPRPKGDRSARFVWSTSWYSPPTVDVVALTIGPFSNAYRARKGRPCPDCRRSCRGPPASRPQEVAEARGVLSAAAVRKERMRYGSAGRTTRRPAAGGHPDDGGQARVRLVQRWSAASEATRCGGLCRHRRRHGGLCGDVDAVPGARRMCAELSMHPPVAHRARKSATAPSRLVEAAYEGQRLVRERRLSRRSTSSAKAARITRLRSTPKRPSVSARMSKPRARRRSRRAAFFDRFERVGGRRPSGGISTRT